MPWRRWAGTPFPSNQGRWVSLIGIAVVALAAFSNEYRVVQDWTPAGPDQEQELNESLGDVHQEHDHYANSKVVA